MRKMRRSHKAGRGVDHRTGKGRPITRALSEEEVKRFLIAIKGHRLEALFVTAIVTGLRAGELLALQLEDLDLSNGRLAVRYTLDRETRQAAETKTEESKRIVYLPENVCVLLREYRASQEDWKAKKQRRGKWQENNLVFPAENGTPLWERNIKRVLQKKLSEAGITENVRFHDLRHSAATLMLAKGASLPEVKKVLGHTTIKTTDRYTHVLEDIQRRTAEKMGDILL